MYLTLRLYAVVKSEGTHLAELPAMGTVVKATSSGRVRRSAAEMAPWSLSSALASSSARRCRSCLALQKCCRQRATRGFAQHERADACSASPLCHDPCVTKHLLFVAGMAFAPEGTRAGACLRGPPPSHLCARRPAPASTWRRPGC
jgi:hypothetical protein